jgi:hypothetical protein
MLDLKKLKIKTKKSGSLSALKLRVLSATP